MQKCISTTIRIYSINQSISKRARNFNVSMHNLVYSYAQGMAQAHACHGYIMFEWIWMVEDWM